MTNTENTDTPINQQGFAAMVVALTLVLVLALMTIGFSQLARREQQNALNKQLSTQANYAAETGINDAIKYLHDNPSYQPLDPDECISPDLPGYDHLINATTGVSYSCLLIDPSPYEYKYDPVQSQADVNVSFTTSAIPAPLTIKWDSPDRTSSPGSVPAAGSAFRPLTGAGSWNSPAVLQFSITPMDGTVQRADLLNREFTTYFYPTTGPAGAAAYAPNGANPGAQGSITPGHCAAVGSGSHCEATITGLPVAPGGYQVHILNLYDTSAITIAGSNGGTAIRLTGGQALIDVTGRARDVLKRLQVRVPYDPGVATPDFTVEGQSICKRQQTQPLGTVYETIGGGTATPGDVCYLAD